jgi:hypothetical protein
MGGSKKKRRQTMKGSSIRAAAVWSLFVFLAFLVLAGWASEVLASDDETTSQSLMDLQGISVMVPPINPDAERDGLKREQILTEIELRLRKGGIKILTDKEIMKIRNFPYLNVTVNSVKDKKTGLYSYDIKVELYKQDILNPEDIGETNEIGFAQLIPIKTWSSELTGSAPGSDLKNSVQKRVDDLADKFINAYLAANPKK